MKKLFVCNMLCVFYITEKYDMVIQKIFSSKIYYIRIQFDERQKKTIKFVTILND